MVCKNAEVVELIKVIVIEGKGESPKDPIRESTQYWTKDGVLLFKDHSE